MSFPILQHRFFCNTITVSELQPRAISHHTTRAPPRAPPRLWPGRPYGAVAPRTHSPVRPRPLTLLITERAL